MSLLSKANTITTPTAYSNGFLHSVKPNVVWETIYESDYSSVTPYPNGAVSGLTLLSNQSILGVDDVLKFTSTISGEPYFYTNDGISSGERARISFDYYIPSGQSCNSIRVGIAAPEQNFTTTGEWATATFEQSYGYNFLIFRAENADIDDVFYLKNLKVENNISADFTFTRNSSATRVNELGYIEDVQIIGGELVSNGDFEEIGSEEVTNGDFSDGGTGWTYGGLVTFTDGKASFVDDGTNTYSYIAQTVFTASKTYKIEVNISRLDGGQVEVLASGGTIGLFSDSGIKKIYHTASAGDIVIKRYSAAPNFDFDIDNVSVKEVGQDWTFGTGWTMGDGKAVVDVSGAYYALFQANVTTIATRYKAQFDLNITSGSLRFRSGSNIISTYDSADNGSVVLYFDALGTSIDFQTNLNCVGSIDNISVKEVTDDTNLPRINYEGFTYENGLPVPYSGKGHLLLEGQRTNLVEYSEDASTYTYVESSNSASSEITPDETQSASLFQTNTSNSTHYFGLNSYSFTSGVTITSSLFVKKGTGRYFQLVNTSPIFGTDSYASYDLENGLVTSVGSAAEASIVDYGNGWYRCILTGTPLSSNVGVSIFFGVSITSANAARSEAHTQELNYHIWGGQCEVGSYSTSYIPTNGSAVTRLGETCNNATHSFPSEGVLYAECSFLTEARYPDQITLGMSDGTIDNRVIFYVLGNSTNIGALVQVGGSTSFQTTSALTLEEIAQFNKFAIRYKQNDFSLWINGVEVATDTSGNTPSNLSQLVFDRGDGTFPFYGKTKMIATFPYLSNDEMECLTGEGYGTFEALAAAYSYTIK